LKRLTEEELMIHGNPAEAACLIMDEGARTGATVILWVESPCPTSTPQPVTVGLPFPKGGLHDPRAVTLADPEGRGVDFRAEPLARWPGGSVKWLLLDFVVGPSPAGRSRWVLRTGTQPADLGRSNPLHVRQSGDEILVETGSASLRLDRHGLPLPKRVSGGRRDVPVTGSARLVLKDRKGREVLPRFERVVIESEGPVRATVRTEGTFGGRSSCRFVARTCVFAGTGLVRIRLTLHNPRRARHAGGLWDLGDRGSILFRALSLELGLDWLEGPRVVWSAEAGQEPRTTDGGPLEIYQDSSGGENWRSRNHVNREGRQPCSFRGYRLNGGGAESYGLRASPVVSLQGADGTLTAAVPEFWQQFPKAIGTDGRVLKVGFFPEQFGDLFELQGGEQKTHTLWLDFGPVGDRPGLPLDWVHRPALVRATPEWYARSGVIPHLSPVTAEPRSSIDPLLSAVVGGPHNLFARREAVDEYGWRNYGEVYADHEAEHYRGPAPVISHYNNQYDLINGTLTQYLRSGEARWYEFADALARHVIDIDIYHTNRDKAAFNGGLFWHTDHYRDVATCTHRAYSKMNAGGLGRTYGGGPSACHNFATGLLNYHFLTGDPQARDVVVSLADWVIHMDEGAESVLGILDPSPTGLANDPGEVDYQGPCRGAGNSVNVLMDAWLLTGQRTYLTKAEKLIRRVVHPDDDVEARDLLEIERRWSYTVFLSALARYLHIKAEASDLDLMYSYAQATLVRYARWMLDHEKPYFDQVEKIEFPTETWAGQEFRKANVLRLAAAHETEPVSLAMRRRGDELAERALRDLLRFPRWDTTRALALVLAEGPRSATLSRGPASPAPRSILHFDFDPPEMFVPQKERVLARLRTPRGLLHALSVLTDVRNWGKLRLGGHL
jgi:hypothetical protein